MPQRTQIVLKPTKTLTASDLRALRENTLRLISRGWQVPVLAGHAAAGAVDGGPQYLPVRAVDPRAAGVPPVGHLVDLVELPDGSLAQVVELADDAVQARFTSPELRPHWTAPGGERFGPLIAHIALTDRPLSAGQTPLQAFDPNEHEFYFPPSLGDPMMTNGNSPTVADEPRQDVDTAEAERPETDALSSAEHDGAEDGADDDTVLAEENEPPSPVANSNDLAGQRVQLAARIRGSRKLPKGLRDRLASVVETLQLSDDAAAVPTVPVAEAVAMIEAAIPENLQFAEGPLAAPAHPRGENFFTGDASQLSDDEAQRIATEQLMSTGFGPSV